MGIGKWCKRNSLAIFKFVHSQIPTLIITFAPLKTALENELARIPG